jgi:hypothetical protein
MTEPNTKNPSSENDYLKGKQDTQKDKGEPGVPAREEEESYASSGPKDLFFLSALIFTVLFVILAVPVKLWTKTFPFLGKDLSFVLFWLLIYAAIVGILLFVKRYYMVWWEQMPHFLRYQINRRTGVSKFDLSAIFLCFAISIYFLFASLLLLPLAIVALIAFLSLRLHRIDFWQVRERSQFWPPDEVPKPEPIEEGGGYDYKEFRWNFERSIQEMVEGYVRIAIRLKRYEEFKNKNPFNKWPNVPTHREIIDELTSRGITDEVTQVTTCFIKMAQDRSLSTYEEIMNILSFVQKPIEYDLSKEENRDYWRYPIETLEDQRGDCDCKSILAATLFHSMRYKVLVLVGKEHLAIAVAGADGIPGVFYEYNGERYYYCETTLDGWAVGQLPQGMSLSDFQPYPVSDLT